MLKAKRNIVRERIYWDWKWSQSAYHYLGFFWLIALLLGIFVFLNGWFIAGTLVAFSTIVTRRLLYWFEVFWVESDIFGRVLEIIRLDPLIKTGKHTVKKFLQAVIAITVIEMILQRWFFQHEALWGINFWFITIILLILVTEYSPPFVLFLGNSDRSQKLFPNVVAGCIPHRVINLLRIEPWAIDKWLARTNDPEKWREMMRRLARISCIIVLDSRFPTDSINEECDWLLTEGLDYKLVIVSNKRGRCAVFDASVSRVKKQSLWKMF